MAGLSKEQLAGKAAYTEANKDIPDAPEWKDLDDEQRQPWIDSALDPEPVPRPPAPAPAVEDGGPQPIERCLTIRDLAKTEYQKQMGGSAEDWDALPLSDVEQWEAMAKLKNR